MILVGRMPYRGLGYVLSLSIIAALVIEAYESRPLTPAELKRVEDFWNEPVRPEGWKPGRVLRGPVNADKHWDFGPAPEPNGLLILAMWLQQPGVSVNGEIPLWGVFMAALTAVAAFAVVRQQVSELRKRQDDMEKQWQARQAAVDAETNRRFTELMRQVETLANQIMDLIKESRGGHNGKN